MKIKHKLCIVTSLKGPNFRHKSREIVPSFFDCINAPSGASDWSTSFFALPSNQEPVSRQGGSSVEKQQLPALLLYKIK